MMKSVLGVVIALLLSCSSLWSQLSYGGQPYRWADKHYPHSIPTFTSEVPDRAALAAEDAVVDQYKEAGYRFGVDYAVNLSPSNSGEWVEDVNTGRSIWRLAIVCPEALSVSFIFDQFFVPKGGEVFVWNNDRTIFLGSFNHKNNNVNGNLPVGIIHDNHIVIEFSIPTERRGEESLHIGQVTYGYREINVGHFDEAQLANRGPFGNSGACNININCPEGDDWQIEKRSVALIVEGGTAICTGALVNNTAQDGTPYFLTANHCLGGVNNWVFYFNHEAANCNGNNGPTNQSIAGSVLRASSGNSDFALLELNDTPPASFNAQYAGWDRSDSENAVTSTTGIHHPGGDLKKICHDEDAAYHSTSGGAQVWYIDEWEEGVTEGGSSGSPLFNQDHRIIGQLFGGFAACAGTVNNGQADWYGRFGVSWNGNSASSRLRDWLDPTNSGVTVLDGYPDGFVPLALDAALISISGIENSICGSQTTPSITLRNAGAETLTSAIITYSLNNGPDQVFNWTGSLAQNLQTVITLPTLNLSNGTNVFEAVVSAPNGQADQNTNNNSVSFSFTAFNGPTVVDASLVLIFDSYADETAWTITQDGVQVATSNGFYDASLDDSTLSIPLCLSEGCYELNVIDDFGDGMCCGYGDGSFTIFNQNSIAIITGGEFEDNVSVTFCLDVNSVEETAAPSLIMYPNPAKDLLYFEGLELESVIRIFDTTGRKVAEFVAQNERESVSVSGLSQGVYVVRYEGEGTSLVKELMIKN